MCGRAEVRRCGDAEVRTCGSAKVRRWGEMCVGGVNKGLIWLNESNVLIMDTT